MYVDLKRSNMKHLFYLFLFMPGLMAAQDSKFEELVLSDEEPISSLRSEEKIRIVRENCAYLGAETAWNPELGQFNTDQCALYENYTSFSRENLSWIDEVKLTTEQDDQTGMEVEVVTFYDEQGQEIEAQSFLASRIEKCKGEDKASAARSCATYFGQLALNMGEMARSGDGLVKSSKDLFPSLTEGLTSELKELKQSRSPAAIGKARELKQNLSSVEKSATNTRAVLPGLVQLMTEDTKKINGISRTLRQLEGGL